MIKKIKNLIDNSNSIVLLAHVDPDGDAIGSLVAFYDVLNHINKSVDMVSSNIPKRFDILTSINKIVDRSNKSYDLAIILDTSTKERIYQEGNILAKCKTSITIDHHKMNTKFSDYNYIEGNIASTTQILYYLFKLWNYDISIECANALMLGLITDTNGFKNDNVDSKSYLMAASLYDMGVNIYNIRRKILSTVNRCQHELIKRTLNRLEFFKDGKIAFSYITEKDFKETGALIGDHEGLVEFGRDIEGVEVSILMRECNGYKISLRSNGNIDVSKIAVKLGGGGHSMAAGIYILDEFFKVKNLIINAISEEI